MVLYAKLAGSNLYADCCDWQLGTLCAILLLVTMFVR